MDYEKKYKEALKKAEAFYFSATTEPITEREVLANIFPELKENEDEKIRKNIIIALKSQKDELGDFYKSHNTSESELVSWLEKQGEQKPADKVEPKFKVGDWITNGHCKCQITFIDSRYWYSKTCVLGNVIDIDKTFHLWTIQDAKDGDVLVSGQIIILFKKFQEDSDCNFVIAYAGIDISGKIQITNKHWLISNESTPATKEQRDLLFQKMHEAGYELDAEKKELKKIEQNITWSEEDEKMYLSIMSVLLSTIGTDKNGFTVTREINWLKSLKERALPQPRQEWSEEDERMRQYVVNDLRFVNGLVNDHNYAVSVEMIEKEIDWMESLKERYAWKPSDEQMRALHDMNLTGNISYAGQGQTLIELYNDLKKLKEK